MKISKLYNFTLPLWILIFIPPYVFILLSSLVLINSAIMLLLAYNEKTEFQLKRFKRSVLKTVGITFFGYIIGLVVLMLINGFLDGKLYANSMILIVSRVIAIAISGWTIYYLNYNTMEVTDWKLKFIGSSLLGVMTAPWIFLVVKQA